MGKLTEQDMRILSALANDSAEWWFSSNTWRSWTTSFQRPQDGHTTISPEHANQLVNAGYAEVRNPGDFDTLLIITAEGREALAGGGV